MSDVILDARSLVETLDYALSVLRSVAAGDWNEYGYRQAQGRDYDITAEEYARQALEHMGPPYSEIEVLGDLEEMLL